VGQITRICEFALGVTILVAPAAAALPAEDLAARYATSRIAEIGEQDRLALSGYLKLYKKAPDSEILADRLFDSAIRSGDMEIAVLAARAKELRDGGNAQTALLLFADAWRAKNWQMADLAADELAQGGNLAFMTPMLKSWVRVARGEAPDFPDAGADTDSFFAYYSADQRIYLDLATGQFAKAKLGLRAIAAQSGDHVRDVMIAGADSLAGKNGDRAFAEALMRSVTGSTEALRNGGGKLPVERGLSALFGRISLALTDQELAGEGLVVARIGNWIAPAQPNMQLALAKILHDNGLSEEALSLLEQQQAGSPYALAALESRIDISIATGKITDAINIATKSVEATPKSVGTKLLYARAQEAAGNLPVVISTYREMTETPEFFRLPPRQQASYRLLLASALDQVGDWPMARVELEKLLTVDPNNAQALNYLGYSLLERGDERDRATQMVRRAYALEPNSSAITDSLGWAYFLQGDAKSAVPFLEKAAKDAGSDVAINEHLGDAYWTVGRRRDARYAWQIASHNSEGDVAARILRKIDIGLPDTRR
jgi:Flp pilus assembly protein TadD